MDRLDEALAALKLQDAPNIRGTAKKFGLVKSTLRRRFHGKTVSREHAAAYYQQRLTSSQEKGLLKEINRLSDRGMPPTTALIRNFAEKIVGAPVKKNWANDFVGRNQSEIKSVYLRNMKSARVNAEYAPLYKAFYDQYDHLIEKYQITDDAIWNLDEKGFLIEYDVITKRIMTLEALRSGRITHASHDGSREFITLLATVEALGTALPPAWIYGGEGLQDTWLKDVDENDEIFFARSFTG